MSRLLGWLGCIGLVVLMAGRLALAATGDAAAGKATYERWCVSCHGLDGRGGRMGSMLAVPARNLADQTYMQTRSDQQLFTAISQGGTAIQRSSAMPAFSQQISEQEIWDTVAYIRTLTGESPAGRSPVAAKPPAAQPSGAASQLTVARLQLAIWPEYDDPRVLVIVRGELAPREAFPTRLTFPIPKQAEIVGAGMISEDNQLILRPHEILPGDTQDFLTLDLPVPRFFIELYYTAFDVKEAQRRFVHTVAIPYPIEILEIDIQPPLQASQFVVAPQPMEQNTDRQGFTHAQFVYRNLDKEQVHQFTIAYTRMTTEPSVAKQQPLPTSQPTSPQGVARGSPLSSPSAALGILTGVVVVFASGAWLWTNRQRHRATEATSEEPVPYQHQELTAASLSHPESQEAQGSNPNVALTPPSSQVPNFCSNCGHKLQSLDRFCAGCGRPLKV
jgi:cytochrome c oxidase cbb3-type subunit 3